MIHRIFIGVLLCMTLLVGAMAIAQEAEKPTQTTPEAAQPVKNKRNLTIGVLDYSLDKAGQKKWKPVSQYLTKQVSGYSFNVRSYQYGEISAAIDAGEVDFLLVDPGVYAQLQDSYDLIGVATLNNKIKGKPYPVMASVIFIHGGWKEVDSLSELKTAEHSSLMASEVRDFGWLITWKELRDNGIDPYADLGTLKFAGGDDAKVMKAVLDGDVFAGALTAKAYYSLIQSGKFDEEKFRIVNIQDDTSEIQLFHSTDVYPEWSFSAVGNQSDALVKRVGMVLMGMSAGSSEAKAAGISGWTVHRDYAQAALITQEFKESTSWNWQDYVLEEILKNHQVVWGLFLILAGVLGYYLWDRSRIKHELDVIKLDQTSLSKKLEFQAFNDPLTGLPNRRLMQDRLLQTIKRSNRDNKSFCVMMADLDHFKEVNDTLGHDAGDQLLRTVAARLQETLRESDTICRLGGDEFSFICNDLQGEFALPMIADRLINVLTEPIVVAGTPCTVGISLGIAMYPEHGQDPEVLLRKADIALYKAKEKRNCFSVYDQETDTRSRELFVLQSDIRTAIAKEQFVVYYQPIINIADKTIVGLEALVRWAHPTKGMIMPDDFIPLARKSGQIKALTQVVMKKAIETGGRWLREHNLPVRISVNITSDDLEDKQFPAQVMNLLNAYNFPASFLGLEITEHSLITDLDETIESINRLSSQGVNFYIDDFGTGYSSIAYLKKLPIQALKIDRSFVMAVDSSENDAVIVKSTIGLAKSLGLSSVAEGVENAEVLKQLSDLGCHLIQGYFICRPLSEAEITGWLKNPPSGFSVKQPELSQTPGA